MEWNPVLEDRLKRAKQARGWRWIGYTLVALGIAVLPVGAWLVRQPGLVAAGDRSVFTVLWVVVGLFLLLGLVLALPAEKAAKEARELEIQKAAAEKS